VPGPVVKGMRPGDQAWLNGRFLPRESLSVSVGDVGFVLGATVTEQLRTFHGDLFLPGPHRERLANSLAAVGIVPGMSLDDIMAAAATVAHTNHAHVGDGDLGVVIFVTPGDQPSQHEGAGGKPMVAVHSFPLAFRLWAEAYESGVSLRSVAVPQVPAACWPIHAKVRSRLHYYLADREAHAAEPGARAVVCHADGRVSETSTANIALVRGRGIVSPPPADALPGVSLMFARRLAAAAGVDWAERSLTAADLAAADEILLTSTPSCLLPATHFDGRAVGDARPGPVYRQLLDAWNKAVGIDIAAQARAMVRQASVASGKRP
jgi:branched-chain amino acid aminotransferase